MAQDFVHCVGSEYYTEESFRAEAERLGVSRRIRHVPDGLVPGESRVYLAFGAGRDSYPRKCRQDGCDESSLRTIGNGDERQVFCDNCGMIYPARLRAQGKIVAYFVPQAVDVVLTLSEERVRTAAKGIVELGQVEARIEEDEHKLRLVATVCDGSALSVLKFLAEQDGSEARIDVLAQASNTPGARIVGVSREAKRGCGYRRSGLYLVASASQSPLVDVTPPAVYAGSHFRGVRKLTDDETRRMDAHFKGLETAVIGERGLVVIEDVFTGSTS